MIRSTGKPQFLAPQTHLLRVAFSSSTSTSLQVKNKSSRVQGNELCFLGLPLSSNLCLFAQITPLNHQSLPSLQESTTLTSTVTVPYALTFYGPSGHLRSPCQRCCSPSVPSSVTQTQMTPLFLKLPGCTRQTFTSTMSARGSGQGNMQCERPPGRVEDKHLQNITNKLMLVKSELGKMDFTK